MLGFSLPSSCCSWPLRTPFLFPQFPPVLGNEAGGHPHHDHQQARQGGGDGEGGSWAFSQPPDAQAARGAQHGEIIENFARLVREQRERSDHKMRRIDLSIAKPIWDGKGSTSEHMDNNSTFAHGVDIVGSLDDAQQAFDKMLVRTMASGMLLIMGHQHQNLSTMTADQQLPQLGGNAKPQQQEADPDQSPSNPPACGHAAMSTMPLLVFSSMSNLHDKVGFRGSALIGI